MPRIARTALIAAAIAAAACSGDTPADPTAPKAGSEPQTSVVWGSWAHSEGDSTEVPPGSESGEPSPAP